MRVRTEKELVGACREFLSIKKCYSNIWYKDTPDTQDIVILEMSCIELTFYTLRQIFFADFQVIRV